VTDLVAISVAETLGWAPRFDWSMLGEALGVEALELDQVDAIVGPEFHATMAVDAGYKVLADLGDYNLPLKPCRKKLIEQNNLRYNAGSQRATQ
jgi:hypothetical protein